MIKVCSLDYLNKESFDTDIMTMDGRILFNCGNKVTPEILLKLYFKEIYIEEEIIEEPEKEKSENSEGEALVFAAARTAAAITSATSETTAKGGPRRAELDFSDNPQDEKAGPRSAEPNFDEEDEQAGPRRAEMSFNEEDEKAGPRRAEMNFDEEEGEAVSKGPRRAEINFDDASYEKNEKKQQFSEESGSVEIKINPEEVQLEFDEKLAEKISKRSAQIAKILGFSDNEIKEIEQVAYYINYGIDKFKKKDIAKKNFRSMKAFASYEKLLSQNKVSERIAEMIKFCANNYESTAFPLNSQIPYYHIVSITSFYEEMLVQDKSKEETLLKMLQMGGNQFNIFVLHKFLRMVREANE
ncbi:MAG: hypothetical protein PHC64_06755 [Candidatus Gastranaerophilales bacterium]|nr:hypothetical protein [Candidatus Gastranaerophilales bacterium]